MDRDDSEIVSFDSFEFILRHPWIILFCIIAVMNMADAYISKMSVSYVCKATLSFEAAEENPSGKKPEDAKRDLISKTLLGDNIKNIVGEVWPELNEKKDPLIYNQFIEMLRNPKAGIRLDTGDKNNPNLLFISFISTDPKICYKVVRAVIDTITKENKRTKEQKIEATISFLQKQLDFYKDKLGSINKEIDALKNELIEKFPELTERERDMIAGVTDQSELMKKGVLETFVMYDDRLVQLNLELLEEKKRVETLRRYLETGEGYFLRDEPKEAESDIFMQEYSKAIAAKELEVADYLSRGYKKEHPQVSKLQSEINKLRMLKESRASELLVNPRGDTREGNKEKLRADLRESEIKVESLQSKIKLMEEYKNTAKEGLKPSDKAQKTDIYNKINKLKELENEQQINQGYYIDIRKQYEEAQLKSRIEKEEAGFKIIVVEEPKIPLKPIPLQHMKFLMMGFMLSVTAGISLAYIIDSLDNSVKSSEDLRRLLVVPVLATIDKITTEQELAAKKNQRRLALIGLAVFLIVSRIAVKIIF